MRCLRTIKINQNPFILRHFPRITTKILQLKYDCYISNYPLLT